MSELAARTRAGRFSLSKKGCWPQGKQGILTVYAITKREQFCGEVCVLIKFDARICV